MTICQNKTTVHGIGHVIFQLYRLLETKVSLFQQGRPSLLPARGSQLLALGLNESHGGRGLEEGGQEGQAQEQQGGGTGRGAETRTLPGDNT